MKLTKRKGFNFFRSYYDVFNELSDKDKLQFIEALLDRQFLGIKPTKLTGLAKFAYISQTNSIDSQVKGYEDKTKTTLCPPPCHGGTEPPTEQVEEKGEVQGEVQDVITPTKVDGLDFDSLLTFINSEFGRKFKTINSSIKTKYKARLKDGYTKNDIKTAITNCKNNQYHKDKNYQYCTPEFFSRADTLDKYSFTPAEVSRQEKILNRINNF